MSELNKYFIYPENYVPHKKDIPVEHVPFAPTVVNRQKTCSKCGEIKSHNEFRMQYGGKLGPRTECRACERKMRILRSKLRKNAPNKPTKCECCGVETKRLKLDHDHLTNEFRGWLCNSCTTGIGRLGDSLEGLLKAVEYLKSKIGE
jgi:hypothetical protein